MNATKLIEEAEWLQENGEAGYRHYYEKMEQRFRRYPVDEKDDYVYSRVENIGGFQRVLDVVFGKEPNMNEDGIEGLHEAARSDVIHFIDSQNECGWNRATSFEKSLCDAPTWFRKEIAEGELEVVPESPLDEEAIEYREKLEDVMVEEK